MPTKGKPSNHREDDEIRRQQNAKPGRIVLGIIFAGIAGLNVFTYLSVNAHNRPEALAWILLSEMWITVLLVAIWYRKPWGRYLLAGLCFAISVLGVVLAPQHFGRGYTLPAYVPTNIIVYAAIFLIIAYLPAIRILTRKRR